MTVLVELRPLLKATGGEPRTWEVFVDGRLVGRVGEQLRWRSGKWWWFSEDASYLPDAEAMGVGLRSRKKAIQRVLDALSL